MTPTPAGFDGERHARRLAPAGGLLVTAGILLGGWVGPVVALGGVGLLLLACVSARDGLLVLGPFARAELTAAARRGRPWLWRAGYAVACFAVLVLFVRAGLREYGNGRRGGMSAHAENFFFTFAAAQFTYLTYLTGVLVSPVVVEEREKRRWEMLLTSDLRNREILLGKIAGRLPSLFEPLLACLPILALLPFLGGVSPVAVGCAAVLTLAGVAGTAAVAAYTSVTEPTAEKARNVARGFVGGYFALSGTLIVLAAFPPAWTFPASVGVTSPVEVRHVVGWANAGNPFGAGVLYATGTGRTGAVEDDLAAATRRFAGFWAGGTFLFGLTAIARLRASRFAGPPPTKPGKPVRRRPGPGVSRPPVTDEPVAWWEQWGRLGPGGLALTRWMTLGWYVRIGLLTAAALVVCRFQDRVYPLRWTDLRKVAEVLAPAAMAVSAFVTALAPMFTAAGGIARERAADTLEGLRLTALTTTDILYQKWAGALRAILPAYRLTATFAVAGVVTGFIPWWAAVATLVFVPPVAMSWAGFGLPFGVRAATPAKASRNLSLTAFGGGYLVLALVSAAIGAMRVKSSDAGLIAAAVLVYLLNGLLGWACFRLAVRRLEGDRG